MIQKVQYPLNTRNNITFGNAANKGFTKGKSLMKATLPVSNKDGLMTTLKDIFFEVFPSLDAQFRKHMSKAKRIENLI